MRKRGARFARRVDPLAAFRSAGRQQPLDGSQKLHLGVALRVHLEALRTGKADELAFHNLAGGVNTSMVLAEQHPDPALSAAVGEAQMAMVRLRENGVRRGRWLMDGPGLQAVMRWIGLYEQQLETVSQQEALDAVEEVRRRVARGLVFERVAA